MALSKDSSLSGNNETLQSETSPATGPARDVAAAKAGDGGSNTLQAELPRPSLKQIEKMRELAIAHNTPASQYISDLFDAKSSRANIAATVLHNDLSKGGPDPGWSTASEQTLRSEIAQLPSNFSNRLEFSRVDCGAAVCEIQAAMRFTSPYQTSQDILDWQSYVYEMLRSPSAQADQLTNPVMILSATRMTGHCFWCTFAATRATARTPAIERGNPSRINAISRLQRPCHSRCVTAMALATSRSRSVGAAASPARAPSWSAALRFWLSL